MRKRTIPFGYRIVDGSVTVAPEEAKTVRDIFDSYLDGASLKAVADILTVKKIVYSDGKTQWDKSMIKRILNNKIYSSSYKYPLLIDEDKYRKAQELLHLKYHGHGNDPIAEALKKRIFCGVCGERFIRNTKNRTYIRWECKRCKNSARLTSDMLYQAITSIFNDIIKYPELLDDIEERNTYKTDAEFSRRNAEVNNMINQPKVNLENAIAGIFNLAAFKYENCTMYISEELTKTIKAEFSGREPIEKVSIDFFDKTVSHITVSAEAKVILHFINGSAVGQGKAKEIYTV